MPAKPRLPSPATVISIVALFVALSASAYAVTLGKHSVGTKQLKTKSVGTKQLKKNAVGTKQLKENAVTGAKVKAASLDGTDINQSTLTGVPNTVHPFHGRLGPNQSLNVTVNGVVLAETANGAGTCNAPTFVAPKAGFGQDADYFTFSAFVAVAAGGTYTATILGNENSGIIVFVPSDGSGGASFTMSLHTDAGNCLVNGYGVAT